MVREDQDQITLDAEAGEELRRRKPKGITWGRWLLKHTPGGVPDDYGENDE